MIAPRAIELRLGRALDLLQELPDESVDLVLTDPPWPSLEAHRAIGTTTRLQGQWFPVLEEGDLERLLLELHRVLRPDRHCYLVADWASLRGAADFAEDAGFRLWTPLIWDKVRIGMGYHWRQTWEAVLFLEKGRRALRDRSLANVLHVPRPSRPRWPCEKPVDLWRPLVANSLPTPEELPKQVIMPWSATAADYNEDAPPRLPPATLTRPTRPVVLDSFVGSGSSLEAALEAGASVVGFDVQEEALELTQTRLLQELARLHELEGVQALEANVVLLGEDRYDPPTRREAYEATMAMAEATADQDGHGAEVLELRGGGKLPPGAWAVLEDPGQKKKGEDP